MDKGKAWTHHHLGQETWLLRRFYGEKDRKKCDSKINLRNTMHVLCVVRKTQKKVIQIFFEKHNVWSMCSEKMAMECKQVSTLDTKLNGEPILCAMGKWLWNASKWARCNMKVNGETRVLCVMRKWLWNARMWAHWSMKLNNETHRLKQSVK